MFKRLLPLIVFGLLWCAPAHAQNTQCATRPPGDSSNACASTAFVGAAVTAAIPACTNLLNSPGGVLTCVSALANGITATTQALNDATTKVATDAFVQNQLAAPIALANGSSAVTQALSDNSTKPATDAFAQGQVAGINVVAVEGADPTGVSDSATAFNNGLTAIASGGSLIIPCGKYKLGSGLSVTVASGKAINLIGQGRDCVLLDFTAASGLTITLNSNHTSVANVSGMTFLTGTASASSIAILETDSGTGNLGLQPQKSFTDIACRGDDGLAVTNYWGFCIEINGAPNQINIAGLNVIGNSAQTGGVGVYAFGTSTSFPEAINVWGSTFLSMNVGVQLGNFFQGAQIWGSNFTAVQECVLVPASLSGLTDLAFVGNQCNPTNTGIGIDVLSTFTAIQILGNDFIILTNEAGIVGKLAGATITGNTIACNTTTGTNGIAIANGGSQVVVTGNDIGGCNTGVWAQASSANGNVQSNQYNGNTTNVLIDVAATGWHCGATTTNCTAGATN